MAVSSDKVSTRPALGEFEVWRRLDYFLGMSPSEVQVVSIAVRLAPEMKGKKKDELLGVGGIRLSSSLAAI